ncbi:hypothetical protein ILUMI_03812 [Ignelater luminosus]|uniref:Uncharacterized protein n=1 Tax=Ignelater luminosus TaxID=2038154 RepID=A0A8K0DA33_IGNLU|nr:hypothetical protein ILUMI_03812 [Ignelater luminosus]
MSKAAQSFSSKLHSWIAPYNIKQEVFTTDGKVVYCNACFKHIGSDQKTQIDAHCTTGSYAKSRRGCCQCNQGKSLIIGKSNCEGVSFRQKFFPDLMEALETGRMTLKDQLGKLSFVEEKLKMVPGKEGKVLQQKFENVFGTIQDSYTNVLEFLLHQLASSNDNNNLIEQRGLEENISFDESMIPYYGKQYLKEKNKEKSNSDIFGLGGNVVSSLIEKGNIPQNEGDRVIGEAENEVIIAFQKVIKYL